MLTPQPRGHKPPFRYQTKHLKTSHHSYIFWCFHKLAATPSCLSPDSAWSRARHNIVACHAEAPEERGLLSSCLTLSSLSHLCALANRLNSEKHISALRRVCVPVRMLELEEPRSRPEAVNQLGSCMSGAGNSHQTLSFVLCSLRHPVVCFVFTSCVLNSAVDLIKLYCICSVSFPTFSKHYELHFT